nr:helix-turn-helix domain-containing protein [Actinomycetota bacterium]
MPATADTSQQLLTARDVADPLRVGIDTIYRLTARGALPAVRWSATGPLRFRPEDVEQLLHPGNATAESAAVDRGADGRAAVASRASDGG